MGYTATTPREKVRQQRSALYRKARERGITLDEERQAGSDARQLATKAQGLINDLIPRSSRDQLRVDNPPPTGIFDGANKSFGLSEPVDALSIVVAWMDSTVPVLNVLQRSNVNPPSSGSFYFSQDDPDAIVVGDAPAVGDALLAAYKVKG